MINKRLPVMLAVAALSFGAAVTPTFAQDAAAPAQAPASDPEAAANEAYKAWKAEADATKKYELGKALVSQHFGTKAAEAVAYEHMFKPANDQQKYDISKVYYDASVAAGKDGAYKEYALGNLATMEKDVPKLMEYGRTYLQAYPQGKFVTYVQAATMNARYTGFQTAIKDKRYPDAIKTADEAFAANENVFIYAYLLTDAGLRDETSTGAKSQFVGKVSAWADRAIQYVESGKVPDNADKAKWEADKTKTLATLYKAKAVDTYLRIANSNPTTVEAYQPAIDGLLAGIAKSDKDPALYFFLASAYSGPYAIYSNQYGALPDDKKVADEGKALFEQVNQAADKVIDAYIKLIAYAGDTSAAAADTKPKLAELWAFRHPDAPDGWKAEVQKLSGGAAATPSK